MKQKQRHREQPGVDVDLQPGGRFEQRKEREFFPRVEESQQQDHREQDQSRNQCRLAQAVGQSGIQRPVNARKNGDGHDTLQPTGAERAHLLNHLDNASRSRMSTRIMASCGQALAQAGPTPLSWSMQRSHLTAFWIGSWVASS